MNREFFYPNQLITDAELLQTEKNAMFGIGYLAQAVLGAATVVSGLPVAPTSPASMSITIGPGSIYSTEDVDATAYGSLGTDTNSILKQGINATTITSACPAPNTQGQSIVYLVEAAYLDNDTNNAVLTYFNSANPSQPFTGPNNTGASQPTVRQGLCSVQVKAGAAATTASATAPAVDTGYTALYTVTVPFGATTITAANIAIVSGAPFIAYTLTQLKPGIGSEVAFGSNTVWTCPPSITRVRARVWGGGGGGGGALNGTYGGSGGGGGGYAEGYFTVVPGTAYAITVGAGGTGVGGGSGTAPSGGSSSFSSFISATGGGGGGQANTSAQPSGAGAGGVGSGGSVQLQGGSGSLALQGLVGGQGGAAFQGSLSPNTGNAQAPSGLFFGCGGSGALGPYNGGYGATGVVILEY